MSQQQGVLTESSHNIVHRGPELSPSPYQHGRIQGLRDARMSIRAIAAQMSVPKSTIFSILKNAPTQIDGHTRPRSGQKRIYIERDIRAIERVITHNPKI